MREPMPKGPVVRRAVGLESTLALAAATIARRRPMAAIALAGTGALAASAAFRPGSRLFGPVTTRARSDAQAALTFDDGPGPATGGVLDALAAAGVRATFFVLGRQAERYPELVRRMVDEGHQVANHGYDHGILVFRGARYLAEQVRRTEDAVVAAAGPAAMTRYLRSPHGFRGPTTALAAARLGYRMVGWTIGVFDSADPGVETIASRVSRRLVPGALVLLHDADGWHPERPRCQTAAAVPAICRAAAARGLEFVRLDEVLA